MTDWRASDVDLFALFLGEGVAEAITELVPMLPDEFHYQHDARLAEIAGAITKHLSAALPPFLISDSDEVADVIQTGLES